MESAPVPVALWNCVANAIYLPAAGAVIVLYPTATESGFRPIESRARGFHLVQKCAEMCRKTKRRAPQRARRFVVAIEGFAYAFLRFNARPAMPRSISKPEVGSGIGPGSAPGVIDAH